MNQMDLLLSSLVFCKVQSIFSYIDYQVITLIPDIISLLHYEVSHFHKNYKYTLLLFFHKNDSRFCVM